MIKEGLPPKRVLKVRDLMLTKARISSSRTKRAIGIMVKKIESSMFSILMATNSAIKIETIKSIIPS